jgi:hypothetical protein
MERNTTQDFGDSALLAAKIRSFQINALQGKTQPICWPFDEFAAAGVGSALAIGRHQP